VLNSGRRYSFGEQSKEFWELSANTEPLWTVTPEKIAEAVRRIVEAAHPVQVILFGSRARGDAGKDSDLDLLVVEREVSDRYAEMVRLDEVLGGLVLPVDLLVIGEQDFRAWAETPGSIYRTASREGRVLYEAA
jgi:predicted nucleotidyltransferase